MSKDKFERVAEGMARKQHEPVKNARAELADASRNASPAAKRANPNLNKVPAKKGK